MDIVERARIFAIAAHTAVGQRRKYTNEPYWVHPAEVSEIVRTVKHTREMLAAAWLHDVVEDTKVTNQDVTREFGSEVGEIVGWLTNISTPEMGNRATRKEVDRQFLAQAPAAAQTVKIADLISNTSSIVQHDAAFARVYLKEKDALLKVLVKADPELFERAEKMLKDSIKQIAYL